MKMTFHVLRLRCGLGIRTRVKEMQALMRVYDFIV